MKTLLWTLLLLASCSPSSLEDFRKEGKARVRHIITELQSIESREDLLDHETPLKHQYEALVRTMIEARKFREEHPEAHLSEDDQELSEELRTELERISHIEGGREMLQRAQCEALIRLDAFEKKLLKKRQKLPRKSGN